MSLTREYGPEDIVMIPGNGPIGICIDELGEMRPGHGIVFKRARTNYDYYDGYDMAEVSFASDKYDIEIGYSNLFSSDFTYSVSLDIYEKNKEGQFKIDVLKYLDDDLTDIYPVRFRKISRHSDLLDAMRNAALIAKEVIRKRETRS